MNRVFVLFLLAIRAILSACRPTDLGEGGRKVSGPARPAGARDAVKGLTTCSEPFATLALAESANGYSALSSYQLPPTTLPLIRVRAQQSNRFRIKNRSAGLRGTVQEQQLREAGILKAEAVPKKGEGVGAGMTLTPSLTFSEDNAGGGLVALLNAIPVLRDFAGVASGAAASARRGAAHQR